MSRLNRVATFLHIQIKSQLKNDWSANTWSRGFSTKFSQNVCSSEGPTKVLQEKIESGELEADDHQSKVMDELQQLYDIIQTYAPPEIQPTNSILNWLASKSGKQPRNNAPKGLYIHGSVGGGKTTLMDIFYNSCHSVSFITIRINDWPIVKMAF